jgi:hypothetical protein
MLMIIKTNGVTHIAINVPTGAYSTMLPSLVSLLENNATFIKQDWSTIEKLEADISVELKSKFTSERDGMELVITSEDAVAISEDFTAVSPEVVVSIKKALESKQKEVAKMRRERDDYKRRLELLEEELAGIQEEERS